MPANAKPLTPAERGRLGGLARAQRSTPEEMEEIGRKGGRTTLERHGRLHFIRIAYQRNGRLAAKEATE